MSKVVEVTDANFDEIVGKSDVPVIVDFWAAWCGPCRQVAPVMDELADELEGKVKIAKIDVDANPAVSARYGITSIPAILGFKDGENVKVSLGARPKAALLKEFDQLIN